MRLYSQDMELVQKCEYEIADCYFQMGDEKESMSRFTILRTKYPDSSLAPEVVWWLGEYYYRSNNFVLARRYFSSLIQDYPKSTLVANAYYALGTVAEEEKKNDEAAQNYRQAILLGKTELAAQAAIALADMRLRDNQPQEALGIYTEVLANYPHLKASMYPKMAEVYRSAGDFAKAIDLLEQSLDLVPADELNRVQFSLAQVWEANNDVPRAIEEYLKVTYLYPKDQQFVVRALLRAAALYENREEYAAAESLYGKVVGMQVEESKFAQERLVDLRKEKH